MKRLLCVTIAVLLSVTVASAAERHGNGRNNKKHSKQVLVGFSPHDVRLIQEYYAPRYRTLPPGLQKKLARTGRLPPGWQKKMQRFPVAIERELVILPAGYRRGVIDGHAVIYDSRRHTIVDVAPLF